MRLVPRSPEGRFAFGVVAVVGAVNLITVGVDAVLPSPEGPPSSSFATAPQGMAAWAELLERSGTEVRRLRERPSDATLPTEGTVVMLDPESFSPGQARALRRFAEGGGRVIAGGAEPGDWLAELTDGDPPAWDDRGERDARVLVPGPETGAAESLRTAEAGVWAQGGGALPLAAGEDGPIAVVQEAGGGRIVLLADASPLQNRLLDDGPIAVVQEAGEGRIVLLADASPLQNRLLDDADNAALALALAGPGPVTFVESVHGYGTATGLSAVPARFGWALILLALSGLVLIAARWPRMGPPEPPDEPLFPPRRAYVDALAATLARSRDRRAAIESVRSAARERLARRAALAPDANDEAWEEAARAAGLSDSEARALEDGAGDEDGIDAGRALARLSVSGRRERSGA